MTTEPAGHRASLCSELWLVVWDTPNHDPILYKLDQPKMLVGRSRGATIRLTHRSVSRRHAEIQLEANGEIMLRDLESRNGTYVNHRRVEQVCRIRPPQLIHFAEVVCKLSCLAQVSHNGNDPLDELTTLHIPQLEKSGLSPAQQRVLECALKGYSEKQIAATLGLSVHTVHNHMKQIYQHFKVHSRSELLAMFVGKDRYPQ